MASLKGHLLIASPYLVDPNFYRTVVLMIHHSDDGAFGVVLNRPKETSIRELWEQLGGSQCQAEGHVNLGGPVSGPLIAVHTNESLGEMEIIPGVYFAAQREHLEKLVTEEKQPFRLFVGHSGWGGGQLESELEQGSWLTTAATMGHIFCDDLDLWKKLTQQIGRTMMGSILKIKHMPPDPMVN
ncbi:MAG TPA: YqgE/AlgH family protein [Planctomycetaceae bacterium]|nr:YqgE/AlgH family protein [Planctomycetaceae bacterium]HIQ21147.1 YqgE/AlgH family protein [Planctomycetota bacterium]